MKYRIVKETQLDSDGDPYTYFVPQYKKLLFWRSFIVTYRDVESNASFRFIKDALEHINTHKERERIKKLQGEHGVKTEVIWTSTAAELKS